MPFKKGGVNSWDPWQSDPRHVRQGLIAMSDFQEDELLAAWETQSFADVFVENPTKNEGWIYEWPSWCFRFSAKESWLRDPHGVVGIATLTDILKDCNQEGFIITLCSWFWKRVSAPWFNHVTPRSLCCAVVRRHFGQFGVGVSSGFCVILGWFWGGGGVMVGGDHSYHWAGISQRSHHSLPLNPETLHHTFRWFVDRKQARRFSNLRFGWDGLKDLWLLGYDFSWWIL